MLHCYIAWDSFKVVAWRTLASQAVNWSKLVKGNAADPSLMKAIRCWSNAPSQRPTINIGILGIQADVNREPKLRLVRSTCFAAL